MWAAGGQEKAEENRKQKEINVHGEKGAKIRVEASVQRAKSGMLLAEPCDMVLRRVWVCDTHTKQTYQHTGFFSKFWGGQFMLIPIYKRICKNMCNVFSIPEPAFLWIIPMLLTRTHKIQTILFICHVLWWRYCNTECNNYQWLIVVQISYVLVVFHYAKWAKRRDRLPSLSHRSYRHVNGRHSNKNNTAPISFWILREQQPY